MFPRINWRRWRDGGLSLPAAAPTTQRQLSRRKCLLFVTLDFNFYCGFQRVSFIMHGTTGHAFQSHFIRFSVDLSYFSNM